LIWYQITYNWINQSQTNLIFSKRSNYPTDPIQPQIRIDPTVWLPPLWLTLTHFKSKALINMKLQQKNTNQNSLFSSDAIKMREQREAKMSRWELKRPKSHSEFPTKSEVFDKNRSDGKCSRFCPRCSFQRSVVYFLPLFDKVRTSSWLVHIPHLILLVFSIFSI
jgi:hypothetical protein